MTARIESASPIFSSPDVAAWLAHYRRLGFEVDAHDGEADPVYGFAELNGASIHVSKNPDHDPAKTAGAAYLYVDDADALWRLWRDKPGRNVEPVATDYGLLEGAHIDPDGNLMRFGSPLG